MPYLFSTGFVFPWGWALPLPAILVTVLQVVAFLVKVTVMIWFLMLIRWTLPRFRYDQLMAFAWKFLFPVAVLNLMVTGLLVALVS